MEDSELTSSHRHTKITTIGKNGVDEVEQKRYTTNDIKRSHETSRMDKDGIVKTQSPYH